ncbi:hypothetical protein [Streptomyces yangpuensis]|uniref:hypothetical protein n=1 Tax=Streptomyces yangpuensis TaxID=1648182 RepID=UPI0036586C59
MSTKPTAYPTHHAEYLAAVEDRAAAATEGPWGVYNQGTLVEVVAGLQENDTGYRCRRQIARLDEEPIDNIPEHATWSADEDYSQLLHDAEFMAQARTDADRLLGIIRELHHHAASQAAALNLVREFRIPMTRDRGGYGELTIERGPARLDERWAITDGAHHAKKVWRNGTWYYLSEIGPGLAYQHTMEEALALGEKVAALEVQRHNEHLRALQEQRGSATGGNR